MSILPEFRTLKRSKKRIRKQTKKPLGLLKRKLDSAFGAMVMERDRGKLCISCGKVPGTQPGHFMRRGLMATRWHPDNTHSQCFRCNCVESGNQLDYADNIGPCYCSGPCGGLAQHLRLLSRKSWKPSREALEQLLAAAKLGHEHYQETWEFYGSEAK